MLRASLTKISSFLILLFLLLIEQKISFAQTNVFHENFENPDSVTAGGVPGWFQNSRLHVSGTFSDSTTVVAGGISFLATTPINFTGNTVAFLQFKHICKISFFDSASFRVHPYASFAA